MKTHFDYIVVGGGTAGAVVAARLAEQPGVRIALIEAGPSDEGNEAILTLRNWPNLLQTELDFDYRIEPQARGNGRIRHARGKMLGGCSSHNSCIAFWPPDEDLRIWEAAGATGWGPEAVRPYLHRVREKVSLEFPPPNNDLGCAFLEAAQQAHFPVRNFAKDPHSAGVGWFMLNKKGGIRQSSSVAYLHPLAQWDGRIQFFTNCFVSQILLNGRCAIGVQTADGPIFAEREIILCCGAFDTPKLLLLSGIGPAEHLREVGVPVQHHLPGVGENLLDHPEGVINWEASRPVPQETTQLWELGLFAHTQPGLDAPDLMFHFGTEPFDINTVPAGYPTTGNGFALTPNVARAKSQGTVRLRSANPADPPRIDFRYFTDPAGHDERVMVAGIRLARELAKQPALKPWIKQELSPGPEVQSDEAISEYVRRTANTVYHPAGTCKMGAVGDETAVVDPQLRLHGLENIRIADASIFPTMIGVNPNLTCFVIGERCVDFLSSE
ncbi:MAG: GMC family oxidoreductase N-terminal domain-containing protein [Anaerolineales bacterium]|nr:GMC family oxidoreductase N-terminal domain-containing protein [Anaerolineales bacterium]